MKAYHKKSTSKYKDELNVDYQYGIQDVLNAIVQKTKKKDDLSKVVTLLNISKCTTGIIKQNLFWAFIYNTLMIPIAEQNSSYFK